MRTICLSNMAVIMFTGITTNRNVIDVFPQVFKATVTPLRNWFGIPHPNVTYSKLIEWANRLKARIKADRKMLVRLDINENCQESSDSNNPDRSVMLSLPVFIILRSIVLPLYLLSKFIKYYICPGPCFGFFFFKYKNTKLLLVLHFGNTFFSKIF